MGWSRARYPRYRLYDCLMQWASAWYDWALTGRTRALQSYIDRGLPGKEIR